MINCNRLENNFTLRKAAPFCSPHHGPTAYQTLYLTISMSNVFLLFFSLTSAIHQHGYEKTIEPIDAYAFLPDYLLRYYILTAVWILLLDVLL